MGYCRSDLNARRPSQVTGLEQTINSVTRAQAARGIRSCFPVLNTRKPGGIANICKRALLSHRLRDYANLLERIFPDYLYVIFLPS